MSSTGILANNETEKTINQEDIVVVLSTGLSHEDLNNQMENYINILEKKYTDRFVEDIKYEFEYDLKNSGNFLLLEVDVDKFFLGERYTDYQIISTVEPITRKVAKNIIDDFKKPVRVIVKYKDKNIFMKKY